MLDFINQYSTLEELPFLLPSTASTPRKRAETRGYEHSNGDHPLENP
jgi:hypothetical protein